MDYYDYKRILDKLIEEKFQKIVNFLHQLPYLQGLTKNFLQKLSYYFQDVRLNRKQVLFEEGQTPDNLYIIWSGDIELIKTIKIPKIEHSRIKRLKRFKKNKATIAILSQGELVGEEELFNNTPYTSTAVCNSAKAVVLSISQQKFVRESGINNLTLKSLKMQSELKSSLRNEHLENLKTYEKLTRRNGSLPELSIQRSSTNRQKRKLGDVVYRPLISIPQQKERPKCSIESSMSADKIIYKKYFAKSTRKACNKLCPINIHTSRYKLITIR